MELAVSYSAMYWDKLVIDVTPPTGERAGFVFRAVVAGSLAGPLLDFATASTWTSCSRLSTLWRNGVGSEDNRPEDVFSCPAARTSLTPVSVE